MEDKLKGLNKVLLIGHVGRDPVLKYTPNGTPVANFSMATNEVYGSNEDRKVKTVWHTIVAWGKLAELVNNMVRKGQLIYVEGKISSREWTDNSGNRRINYEIIMRDFSLLQRKESVGEMSSSPEESIEEIETPFTDEPITEDDIPF